jgi:hypothetical protein
MAAIPTMAALWGLHRGGDAEGAVTGLLLGLFAAALLAFPALKLIGWLAASRRPPVRPFDVLYWWTTAALASAILVGVTVLIGAYDPIEEHGVDGWVDGLIAGALAAALFGFVAARLNAWLTWLRGPAAVEAEAVPSRLQDALAPTLAELESVRQDAGRRIRRRAAWASPLGAGICVVAWAIYWAWSGQLELLAPPAAVVLGGAVGYSWASSRLNAEYERLYKARVLPRLVAMAASSLTFQRPPPPNLELLRRFHVFRHFSAAHADDAIRGAYRGLALGIVQLQLSQGWGPWRRSAFRGLLIEIELQRGLAGTTAIASDAGAAGNFRDELVARNIQRVGLESPAFERLYEVYGTDQVIARTLVTPDFMERFTAMGQLAGFARPLALAKDRLLQIALPRSDDREGRRGLFEAPTFEDPAADDHVLQRLHHNLMTVLRAADAVIGLDSATHARAAGRPRRSPKPTAAQT